MPLVVPVLRIVLLFLNVYDSFKTLKAPPSSTRSRSKLNVRASIQRKRDMKGCLAVWIIWCCLMTYERVLEGLVYLFIPFYDEMKGMILLFFIVTRARGAEPIYLHVIRPLLKPYTSTLDICLDLTCMVGDIVFLVLTLPLRTLLACWHQMGEHGRSDPHRDVSEQFLQSSPELKSTDSTQASAQYDSRTVSTANSLRIANAGLPPPRKASNLPQGSRSARCPAAQISWSSAQAQRHKAPSKGSTPSRAKSPPRIGVSLAGVDKQVSLNPSHEIWTPPPSSYADSEEDPPIQIAVDPVKSRSTIPSQQSNRAEALVDEWRIYPPFPSAYPPTPIIPNPSLSIADKEPGVSSNLIAPQLLPFPSISEDPHHQPPQDLNLNLQDGPSDTKTTGIPNIYILSESSAELNADMDFSDEDAFNVTLETPRPPRMVPQSNSLESPGQTSDTESSTSSLPSRSTTLNTVDCGSSLRTRTTSESSSSLSLSDSLSVAGSKRPFPGAKAVEFRSGRSSHTQQDKPTVKARMRHQPSALMVQMSQQQILSSMNVVQSSDDDESDRVGSLDPGATSLGTADLLPTRGTKRRRVTAGKGTVRPPKPPRRVGETLGNGPSKVQKTRSLDDPPAPQAQVSANLRPPTCGRRSKSSQAPNVLDETQAAVRRQTRSRSMAKVK